MVFAFDSLSFAKHLRDHGVPQEQAEAHAEAARQFIMAELVTRYDLDSSLATLRHDLDSSLAALRHDLDSSIAALRHDLDSSITAVRRDLGHDLDNSIAAARHDLDSSITAVRHDLEVLRREFENKMDSLSLRLTVRLGALIAVGVAVLAAIIKL